MRATALCSFLLTIAPCLPASGETLYTDKTTFLSNAGPVELESFENHVVATAPHPAPGFSARSIGSLVITNSTDTPDLEFFNQPTANGHATDGVNYLVWYGLTSSDSITFAISSPVSAFGISIMDYGSPSHSSPLTFLTDTGYSGVAATAPAGDGNEQFFGIVGGFFTRVTLTRPSLADGIAFDSLYYDIAYVPEPSPLSLAGVSAIALAALRRRK